MTDGPAPNRAKPSGAAFVLGGAFVIALLLAALFYLRGTSPADEQAIDVVENTGPTAPAPTGRCVSAALALSRATYDLTDPAYTLIGPTGRGEGRFADEEFARNIVRLDASILAEGAHTLVLTGTDIPFTVDRTPPRLVGTEPSLDSCPGPSLAVRMAPSEDIETCGPVTCTLEQNGTPAETTVAIADGDGLICTLNTDTVTSAGGDWRLTLRDGAGNVARTPLEWPEATVIVNVPPTAQPGTVVTARATGTPGGGAFAVGLLAGGDEQPTVTTRSTAQGSVATIRFTAPRDSQVVGIDVAYRTAPHCPITRPPPAEVEVSTDGPGRRYDAAKPSLCGNGELDAGEACDSGEGSAQCNYDCTAARCGDGVLNPFAGEQCDGGLGCSSSCTLSCGNGVIEGLEQCDGGGESAACNLDCTLTRCGDEITNLTAGEQCDDGGLREGDGCSAQCRIEGDFEEEDPGLGLGRWFGN